MAFVGGLCSKVSNPRGPSKNFGAHAREATVAWRMKQNGVAIVVGERPAITVRYIELELKLKGNRVKLTGRTVVV